MTEVAEQAEEWPVPLTVLFTAFLIVSLCGIGGAAHIRLTAARITRANTFSSSQY
jgi:hypothetical protein